MISNESINLFLVILTAISLIVTIVGWTITFRKQKEILERQIEADIEKDKIYRYVTLTLDDLGKIETWIKKGYEIYGLLDNQESHDAKEKIIELYKEWETEYEEDISFLAYHLDTRSKTYIKGKINTLEFYLGAFCNGVHLILDEVKKNVDWNFSCGGYAKNKIDMLKCEALNQPIPDHFMHFENWEK